jgi:hypothetical protein
MWNPNFMFSLLFVVIVTLFSCLGCTAKNNGSSASDFSWPTLEASLKSDQRDTIASAIDYCTLNGCPVTIVKNPSTTLLELEVAGKEVRKWLDSKTLSERRALNDGFVNFQLARSPYFSS